MRILYFCICILFLYDVFFYFIQNTEFIRYHCIVCKNLTSILQFYFQWLADKTKYILKPTANVVFVMQAVSII